MQQRCFYEIGRLGNRIDYMFFHCRHPPPMHLRNKSSSMLQCSQQAPGRPQRGLPATHGATRRCPAAHASTGTAEPSTSIKDRPDWTGQSNLSTIVNFVTRIPLVKHAAKSLFKDSMRKQGVDWDAFVQASDLPSFPGRFANEFPQIN